MVHYDMDDCEDLERPSVGKHSICVKIITMQILHVHMLGTTQLVCNVRCNLNRMCISKVLQCFASET